MRPRASIVPPGGYKSGGGIAPSAGFGRFVSGSIGGQADEEEEAGPRDAPGHGASVGWGRAARAGKRILGLCDQFPFRSLSL
jgi:hypothetical protein